jgi:hypothetical protein
MAPKEGGMDTGEGDIGHADTGHADLTGDLTGDLFAGEVSRRSIPGEEGGSTVAPFAAPLVGANAVPGKVQGALDSESDISVGLIRCFDAACTGGLVLDRPR